MVKEHGTTTTVVIKGVSEAAGEPGQSCPVVFYGQNLGKRYFLEKYEQIIGRSDSASICVDQESVSRKRARLVGMDDGGWRMMDLGTATGTFVNDQPVADAELYNGDVVRVGQTIFNYLSGTNIKTKSHEEFFRLTAINELTQADSKRFLLETLDGAFHRTIRHARPLSLAMLDRMVG